LSIVKVFKSLVFVAVPMRVLSLLLANIHAHGYAEEKREYVEQHPKRDASELRDVHAAPPF
jgi:hypothetical protein